MYSALSKPLFMPWEIALEQMMASKAVVMYLEIVMFEELITQDIFDDS